ncbi:MAG TPA: ABC transporter permease [Thermoanaerobaculia bacterium]|nr:ABC transporter permease [Thermoanaerobaculia bacterium]
MDRMKGWLKQLRVLLRKDQVEGELDEEVGFHLRMETERYLREGMSPREARRAARLAFGGVERAKEEVRDARWVHRIEVPLADARYALRTLRSRPGLAAAAILTIALGVGGTTAVFSVVQGVLLRPLPYEAPGQLVRLYQFDAEEPEADLYVSAPHFKDYRERASSFEDLAAVYTYDEVGADLVLGDRAERIRLLPVSADYFRVLRQEPVLGSGFTRADETGERLAVVSGELWRRSGLDRQGLGAGMVLDGEVYTVVGVMPAGFEDPLVGRVDAWVPQNLHTGGAEYPGNHYLSVLGRLAPGLAPEQARREMAALDAALLEKYPEVDDDGGFRLVPLHEDLVAEARPALLLVLGVVVLVLLVASVNLANLLLVRSLGRLREVAVRSALGAERRRILGQLLTESAVLGLAGGLAGVAVAYAGLELLLHLGRDAVPRASEVGIDGKVLALTAAVALVTGVAAGLLPAVRLARSSPLASLGEASRAATASRGYVRLRRVLVAGQVGLALTLLVGATSLAASVYRLSRVDLGLRTEGILTFELNLPVGRYDAERRAALHARMPEALAALPEVRAVGTTSVLPATGISYNWGTWALTGPHAGTEQGFVDADQRVVGGSYFQALGIPLLEGRLFDPRDTPDAAPVAVVSRSLAEHLFRGGAALGQEIRMGGIERRIVGVVGDVALDPEGPPGRFVYHPYSQYASRNWALKYLVAAEHGAEALLPAVRAVVAEVDPRLVVHRPATLDEVIRRGWSQRRFAFALTAAFALLALALAAIGLYGVLAYDVRQRRREIGVRLAMGAGPARVAGMVLRDALRVTAAGVVVGMVGALALGGFLSSLVFRTDPTEPLVLAGAAAALLLTASVAGLLPAWRALRVSPRAALLEP